MAVADPSLSLASNAAAATPATRGLLRFTTCGSVDDGKSTLIGRLLHDSKSVYEDQLASVRNRAGAARGPAGLDLALLTDGLRAEREQGITIDVAYRYFSTPRRSFIIADTPGHEQYTRNMATGASTADAAIVLLDATKGVLTQSRRHAFIAHLLGIPCLIAAVNKMDLMEYRQSVFDEIAADFRAFAARLGWPQVYALPVSALAGDNVVERSAKMPWFSGPPLLEYLETAPAAAANASAGPLRFPVQSVVRSASTAEPFRGLAGTIVSGQIRPGDRVRVLTAGQDKGENSALEAQVTRIVTFDGDREQASAGQPVTLALDRELDIGRGDLIVRAPGADAEQPERPPQKARRARAMLVWMDTKPSSTGTLYWLHHTTRAVRARLAEIRHRVDVNTLEHLPAAHLDVNDIAEVEVECRLPICFDPYTQNRETGAFILIDPATNATVAAGMLLASAEIAVNDRPVSAAERQARWGHPALGIWVGEQLPLAVQLERALFQRLWNVIRVDTDGYAPQALTALAGVLRAAGVVTVFSGSDPHRREAAAAGFAADEWHEAADTDLDTLLAALARRDDAGESPRTEAKA